MWNSLFLFLIIFCHFGNLNAQSPSYVDFEWDLLKAGYVLPIGSVKKIGISIGTELRINIVDNFSLGLSGSIAQYFPSSDDIRNIGVVSISWLFTGDYYLRDDSKTRPFLGGGLGKFSIGEPNPSGFGVVARAGFEIDHVRLYGQYNSAFEKGHHDYFELVVAFTLWGGYKGNAE